jgi:transcriptional regulator with XRE-family HTH domain
VDQLEPSPTTFGALVRAFRLQRGWTQQGLAERWGFTREYVSQIERGKRKLYGEESVVRLAEILDIPLERLQAIGKYVPHTARSASDVADADDALLEALLGPAQATVKLSWLVWYVNSDTTVVDKLAEIARRLKTAVSERRGRLRTAALELLAYANEMLGKVAFDRLEFPLALSRFQEMHDLGRELNDSDVVTLALTHQADVARRRGRYDSAIRQLEAAEASARGSRTHVRGLRWQTLARCHAEYGNKAAFLPCIDAALHAAAHLPEDEAASSNDFTYQEVTLEQAQGLTLLWEPLAALEIYDRPEHRDAFRPLRELGNFTILRAQAHAYAGEIEEGVRLGIEGLGLARLYRSPRHLSRVQRMHDRLSVTPHRDSPHLRDLADALRAR